MTNDRYEDVTASSDSSEFKFMSNGKNGAIEKLIQYNKIPAELPELYNLGFGNLNENGKTIDDLIRSDNGDMMKIFSTVAFTVNNFIESHPEAVIYVRGSDGVRTRAYQMAINKHYDDITRYYQIYGHVFIPKTENSKEKYYKEPFQKNKNYYGFLVVKNKIN